MLKLLLVWRLGLINIFRVVRHRLRLRNKFYEKALPVGEAPVDADFWVPRNTLVHPATQSPLQTVSAERADEIVAGWFRRFEDEKIYEGSQPQWHKLDYVNSRTEHFSTVEINKRPGVDVKLCWDLSRFKWVTQLAVAAALATEENERLRYQERCEELLRSWVIDNGYHKGVNWACGQEVSIRGLHLMVSTFLFESHCGRRPGEGLLALLKASYDRVKLTIDYSLAQDNNHSLTESLFLYFSSHFLESYGISVASPLENTSNLRRLNRVMKRLIQQDGSFAMYSVNYHRAVCDILSLSKVIDVALDLGFWLSAENMRHVQGMHAFLSMLVDGASGGAPNIGHNDGSLHAVQYSPFGDFSPSVVFMGAVFSLDVDEMFESARGKVFCFSREVEFKKLERPGFSQYDSFGLIAVSTPSYRAFFKYPVNKFRPQQQDFLHFDLWVNGANLLRDSGTYSYNPDDNSLIDYFDDATAHNVPFLHKERFVDRVSRFLYLEWPNATVTVSRRGRDDEVLARIANAKGQTFLRKLLFSEKGVLIKDQGPKDCDWAVVYNLGGTTVRADSGVTIAPGVLLEFDVPVEDVSSLYSIRYLDKQVGARLIANARGRTALTTKVSIQDLL
ncbi:heparinase II/III domain-containing protein [Pseudomonas sp. GB2N2]